MDVKKTLPLIMLFCCCFSVVIIAQETYTYEEAKNLLTNSTSEFTPKNAPASTPTIGEQIKQIRIQKEVETNTLAQAIGITKSSLIKIEQNLVIPTRELLFDIEKYLNCDIIIRTID